jgi:IclR family KDG regulon transcriptional repressor
MKPMSQPTPQRDYPIKALQRGMQVLDTLLEVRTPLTLEDICQHTGLPKSSAFRVVVNLLQGQYLVETEDGFWLGLKMLRFGSLVEEGLDLKQQAGPYLKQLRDRVNETVHLAVLDDNLQVVYLEKLSDQHAIGLMMSRVGSTAPLHCTALGKVMAAFKPEREIEDWVLAGGLKRLTNATIIDRDIFFEELGSIRQQGYATDRGEFETSVRCLAAPIRDRSGAVVAAISISGPADRMPRPLTGSSSAGQLVETAHRISQALGYSGVERTLPP